MEPVFSLKMNFICVQAWVEFTNQQAEKVMGGAFFYPTQKDMTYILLVDMNFYSDGQSIKG